MLLPLLLLAAAEPAPVDDAAYLADCATYATAVACRCIADRLETSNDGRLMLELTTAKAASPGLTDEQNAAAVAAIRQRYGIAAGEPVSPRLEAVMDTATAVCGVGG